jgi:hypothetical protein
MKHNINVIESVWRRLRKPTRAPLAAICSQDGMYEAGIETKRKAQTLDSAVWQHMERLGAERYALLTMAKTVVRLRDMNPAPTDPPATPAEGAAWPLTVFSS